MFLDVHFSYILRKGKRVYVPLAKCAVNGGTYLVWDIDETDNALSLFHLQPLLFNLPAMCGPQTMTQPLVRERREEGGRAHAGFIVVLVVDCKVTVLRLEQLAYKCVYVHVCAYACVRMCIYACPYLSVQ